MQTKFNELCEDICNCARHVLKIYSDEYMDAIYHVEYMTRGSAVPNTAIYLTLQEMQATLQKSIAKTMKKKSCLFIGLIVATTICLYFSATYGDFQIHDIFLRMIREEDYFANEIVRVKTYRERGVKTILLWKTMFGDKNFYFGKGNIFRDCPFNKCKVFNDQNYLNVEDYDAILFHGNEMNDYETPQKRKTTQFYVYVNLESPANREVPQKYRENYFNLTMTYRLDSDILWTYDIIEDKSGKFIAPSKNADWSAIQNTSNIFFCICIILYMHLFFI